MEWVHASPLLFLLAALVLTRLVGLNRLGQGLSEALDNFRGGGPPTPMHPVPSNDGTLLRKRAR